MTSDAAQLLIVAGAGTGKTRTLTCRAARLIASGLEPRRMMLCTFTNRAARQMIRRVGELLQAELRTPWAGTFHHIANVALRRFAPHLGLESNYSILDREDAKELLASCLAEEGPILRQKRFPRPGVLQHLGSTALNRAESLDEVVVREAPRFHQLTREIERVLARYAARKLMLGLVDYDDLLLHLRTLLREHPAVGRELSCQFEHVLVDEYQDTNRLQAEIVDLCAREHGNLTVVGDDAQSIYAFRGAQLENMVDFTRRYPDARVCKLELSYRSVPEILRLANRCIRFNQRQLPKQLAATRAPGMMPVLLPLEDSQQQASFVAQRVLELHQEEELELGQMAVLYRAHAHSLELQLELTRRNIPYLVRSGVRFFEQAHIKDVTAYLKLVHNPADPLAWQRVLRTWSGVGRRSASVVLEHLLSHPRPQRASEALAAAARGGALPSSARASIERLVTLMARLDQDEPIPELLSSIVEDHYREYAEATYPNARTRLHDLSALGDYARRYETLERFLSEMSLSEGFVAEGISGGETPESALTLSTVHQAKGLEWRVVFVIGLFEGGFPQPMAARSPSELEEERRLFYVAATRAMDQLYLCYPRFEEGESGPRRLLRLSRFVDELGYDGAPPYERWEVQACSP